VCYIYIISSTRLPPPSSRPDSISCGAETDWQPPPPHHWMALQGSLPTFFLNFQLQFFFIVTIVTYYVFKSVNSYLLQLSFYFLLLYFIYPPDE
jgi:hypothetical protein